MRGEEPRSSWPRWLSFVLVLVLVIGAIGGYIAWDRGFREHPQPEWVTATPETRFKYGSIGAENDAGIPYWIFYVLPRIFPEKLPGPGGYAVARRAMGTGPGTAGGLHEEGDRLPARREQVRRLPQHAPAHGRRTRARRHRAGRARTTNVEGFFRFFVDCAKDPRFTPDNVLWEIMNVTELSWLDKAIYRFLIIPITKKRLLEREQQFAWVYHAHVSEWGRGRDDAMNLTKYFMLKLPMDDSFGPTDMPSIWNLKKYDSPTNRMNWAGDSHDAVLGDHRFGARPDRQRVGPKDKAAFLHQIDWLKDYLRNKPPPKYPFAVDSAKASAGKAVFDRNAPDATRATRPARRCRSPRSAPIATGSTRGARISPSPRTRSSGAWASNARGSSKCR